MLYKKGYSMALTTKPDCFGEPDVYDESVLSDCRKCSYQYSCADAVSNKVSKVQTSYYNQRYNYGSYGQGYGQYRRPQPSPLATTALPTSRTKNLIDPTSFVLNSDTSVAKQFFTHVSLDVAQVTALRVVDLINVYREDYVRQLHESIQEEDNEN